jgi:hypothetical protein
VVSTTEMSVLPDTINRGIGRLKAEAF